jgi:hypothetical protein
MKILRIILLVVVIIIAIPLVAAFFVPSDYHVTREIIIDKPKIEVFDYMKYLKNQDNFSVWAKMDPDMKKEYHGTDGTIGFVSAWDSENSEVGKGEQEIIRIIEGDRVDFEIRFIKPFEATSPAYITTESIADSITKVTWGFDGHSPYPFNLMLVFMNMEEMIGNDLQSGLHNLKGIIESKDNESHQSDNM